MLSGALVPVLALAAPPGPPTPAAAEVEANWLIPLMIARAVQGGTPEEAVDWAAQRVEAIYAKYK